MVNTKPLGCTPCLGREREGEGEKEGEGRGDAEGEGRRGERERKRETLWPCTSHKGGRKGEEMREGEKQ